MTPKAAAAFAAYRAMGSERSLAKLCGETPGKLRQLEEWSSRYGWQDLLVELEEQEIGEAVRLAARTRSRVYLRTLDEYDRRTDEQRIQELAIQELNTIYDRMRPPEANAVPAPGSIMIAFPERADGPQ